MDRHTETLLEYLKSKYKRLSIGKKEMANELNISVSTLNLYISKGSGLPNNKKLGSAKNARVVFNIVDVAQYLTQTIKTV